MKITERECHLLAFRHQETPWVPSPTTGQDTCIPTVIEEGARGYGVTTDWFGVKYLYREDQPGPMPVESDPKITDIENWRDVVTFPDLDAYDWEGWAAKDTAGWDRENKLSNVILINGCFESLHMFCGFEEALVNIMTDEEASSDFMGAMADYKIGLIERIAKYYKPDMIQFHDDYSNNSNLFMSVEKWQRILKPHLKRVIDAVHGLGMIYQHHSCGKIHDLVPELVGLGIDALNPVQIQNNPLEIKQQFGDRLTVCGGFNNQGVLDNPSSTMDEIKASINETLHTLAPGGKWVALCGFLDKFPEREQIWLDCLDEYNRPLMEKAGVPWIKHTAAKNNVYNLANNAEKQKA